MTAQISTTSGRSRYLIEPGDWESATGESVDEDVIVDKVEGHLICEWKFDESHEKWDSECGNSYSINDGTPSENEMKFCMFCGKELSDQYV